MADAEIIPIIDLGPYLAGIPSAIDHTAGELRFALTEIGFYFIVNHGVSPEQIQAVFRQAARFHALPLEKKLEVKLDKHNVGYLPIRGDTLRTSTVETVTKANINEAFFVARDLPSDHPEVLADGASAVPIVGQPVCRASASLSSLIARRWSSWCANWFGSTLARCASL
jgi:isopenicillin N synthase-like dioxygenase